MNTSVFPTLKALINNMGGRRMVGKILVIESDDWGSVRMPNKAAYDKLLKAGVKVNNSAYCTYDCLEEEEDVAFLLHTLSDVKNNEGQAPILTANFVVSNPDFEQIKKDDYKLYHYEPIANTYIKWGKGDVLDSVKSGMAAGLLKPQFHGREHVNVPLWLELLQNNNDFRLAFELGMWGLSKDVFPNMRKSIQATYDSLDIEYCNESIESGLRLFFDTFGYHSKTFIANNYIWPSALNETLANCQVEHFQGMKYQLFPIGTDGERQKRRVFMGQQNSLGMTYSVRNCFFEPSELNTTYDQVIKEVHSAFLLNKPAIVCTHRMNYSGGLSKAKRDQNLQELSKFLKAVVKIWPDVKFCSSDELAVLLRQTN